jgi:putative transposase
LLKEQGITCSMSSAGEVWDNSAMESFISSLKTERTARKVYRTRAQARADVFDCIERFYNPTRRHSTLGYVSPIEFEKAQKAKGGVHETGSSSQLGVLRSLFKQSQTANLVTCDGWMPTYSDRSEVSAKAILPVPPELAPEAVQRHLRGIMQNDTDTQEPHWPPMPRFTWRLTFAYKQDDIRLVRAEHVQMIAPASVGPAPVDGQSGQWLEVRGGGGELLYHRVLPELVQHDREVFTNEPGRSMHRVPINVVEGEFEVLVPDMPGAEHLTVHGHASDTKRIGAARVLARESFKDLPRVSHTR